MIPTTLVILDADKYCPVLFSSLSPSLEVGEFKAGCILMSPIYTSVSWQIQDGAKPFASIQGQNNIGGNNMGRE